MSFLFCMVILRFVGRFFVLYGYFSFRLEIFRFVWYCLRFVVIHRPYFRLSSFDRTSDFSFFFFIFVISSLFISPPLSSLIFFLSPSKIHFLQNLQFCLFVFLLSSSLSIPPSPFPISFLPRFLKYCFFLFLFIFLFHLSF